MAQGKTHDRINLIIGSVLTGVLVGFERNFLVISGFMFGFLFSTLIFSPDIDLGPKKRARFLQIFIYPYSLFFKHRGHSHNLLFGTLTRVIYGIIVYFIVLFTLNKMNYISFGTKDFLTSSFVFIKNYNYSLISYKFLTWTYLGMFLADVCHILVDVISSKLLKIKRKIF